MTMHLARGLTTISTKRPKQKKLTQKQLAQLELDWKSHNKEMRRKHLHSLQFAKFDDYVAYVNGTYKAPVKKQEFREYQPSQSYVRETPKVPSLGQGVGNGLMKERQVYTGTLIKGIATMHKSNAVPVLNDEQAKDIAQMRRN